MVRKRGTPQQTASTTVQKGSGDVEDTRPQEKLRNRIGPAATDAQNAADDCDDDTDEVQFDPNAKDFLGDFGLDDDEAVPDENDFWFDDLDDWED